FAISALYLGLIVRRLAPGQTAWIVAALYCAMPLGLLYSRAIHVDFSAIAFAHAMAYHLLRGYEKNRAGHLVLGAIAAAVAFAIKVPYAFYFAIPIGVQVCRMFDKGRLLRLVLAGSSAVALF